VAIINLVMKYGALIGYLDKLNNSVLHHNQLDTSARFKKNSSNDHEIGDYRKRSCGVIRTRIKNMFSISKGVGEILISNKEISWRRGRVP
jgi:hypothetical protein